MAEPNSDAKPDPTDSNREQPGTEKDPVRRWTLVTLVVALVLLVIYLVGDRITPYSTQARIHALVVPVAAEVSGTVIEVAVTKNQPVRAGDLLFRLDPAQYELAVAGAEAALDSARQSIAGSSAGIAAAEANVRSAQANLERSRQDAVRLKRIKEQDPGALSDRRIEQAEASLEVAEASLVAARASLKQAIETLGETGDDNSAVQQAISALDQARLNLARTEVRAPTDGVVTDVRVDRGNFAGAGAPQMTFISTRDVWVQADFTENNLGHVEVGDEAVLLFDVYPGQLFDGRVQEVGFGVAVDSAPLGSLPTIQNDRQWLRSAQRFPVVVTFEMDAEQRRRLRVGAQVSVLVYATENPIFHLLARVMMRFRSWLSYAY